MVPNFGNSNRHAILKWSINPYKVLVSITVSSDATPARERVLRKPEFYYL